MEAKQYVRILLLNLCNGIDGLPKNTPGGLKPPAWLHLTFL
jgi:hypothetical protein